MTIEQNVAAVRRFYLTRQTQDPSFRRAQLANLARVIKHRENDILFALHSDLNKSRTESYLTEVALVLGEIHYLRKKLKRLARPQRKIPAISQMPGTLKVISEPYGVALIMAPWNYPFQLTMAPLAAAIAAGNCVILKPSADSPATSALIHEICCEALAENLVRVIEGGRKANQDLLAQRFDYIFFTGSPAVGKVVMQAAARNLTPLTLELGGKSPCIVDASANLPQTAKRILFGKLTNSGQTCVAPDYLYVERKIKQPLIDAILTELKQTFSDPSYYRDNYVKMIRPKHFDRVLNLLKGQKLVYPQGLDWLCKPQSGEENAAVCSVRTQQIFPVLVDEPGWDSPLMQEEIFGPVLPILCWDDAEQMLAEFDAREKPLALYVFSNDRNFIKRALKRISSGGVCINDTLLHMASHKAPFGGVGQSGMGNYHGKAGFRTFSHERTVLRKFWPFDIPLRHHPYTEKNDRLIRKIIK